MTLSQKMFLELLITMRLCVESEIKQKRKDAFVETRPWVEKDEKGSD